MNRAMQVMILLLAWSAGLALAQPTESRHLPALKQLREARPVQFDEPLRLWKNGKLITTHEAVVLRVEVDNPYDFAPKGAVPPHILYGTSIAHMVVSPLIDGIAVLVAAPLEPGEPSKLTVIYGTPPEWLGERAAAEAASRPGLPVPVVEAAALRATYPNIEAFRRDMQAHKPPR
jgi:hypothetical protein